MAKLSDLIEAFIKQMINDTDRISKFKETNF